MVLQAFHPPSGFLRTNSESIGNELPVSEYLKSDTSSSVFLFSKHVYLSHTVI